MKILITGEHGYIASMLADFLRKRQPEWEVAQISVRDEEWTKRSFQKTDAVIHTAAIVHQNGTSADIDQYKEVNVRLTLRLAEKCRREGVGQFIFLSTMSVYGIEQGVIGAKTVPHPITPYGRSKWKAEQMLLSKFSNALSASNALNVSEAREQPAAEERGNEMALTIVRPPMVYGPGCQGNYVRLSQLAQKTPVFPKTDNRRSMIYIDNLCGCLYELAKQKRSGIFFPQDADYVNTSSLVLGIAGCHGHKCVLVSGLNLILKVMIRRFSVAKKVFGTLVYQNEISEIPGITYQLTTFQEAVRRTEGSSGRQ